ncbi:SgcQ protein, partial [Candidatus Acetothermia bacterium]
YRDADGFIVGTSLKEDGRLDAPIDPARVQALAEAIAGLR